MNDGFLGEEEMAERRALAASHGNGTTISWVEAVILGAGSVRAGCDDERPETGGSVVDATQIDSGNTQAVSMRDDFAASPR